MAEAAAGAPRSVTPRSRLRGVTSLLPTLPFFAYVTVFLLIPTLVVVIGAFAGNDGGVSLDSVKALGNEVILDAFGRSIALSAMSALIGAVLGALLAYALTTAKPGGVLRRTVTAAAGVLAQFGGVTLAFAFLATIGLSGFVTVWLQDTFGFNLYENGVWLFELPGLTLIYTYFQIPLMVIVFLPALDGLRPQWREATENLGGTTWQYWTRVAGPLLAPAFLGSTLLLFANAFSAYATAAALVSQGSPLVPLQIRGALTSEVVLGQQNLGKAMALGMVVVVALVMTLYALLQRRTSKWLG
ncbi:ABC transporter permease [Paractinoplanes brasiliensis]|uniref:Putative spermidine/putrescine transport system permease protein n=1 Tax=Paractinoplanes brasiliensis TaxID=52695 RepID=A0A4R6J9F4_9ACTN|nr:ABC transporter permease subunit [Actinoplanes brasiliensis]TDO32112.1 putative spermidine/putrescine transport system permease protein [Actinoplanes brasiliensis]GID28162.1 ABC transporter permease [Actinoplanes brasiliensis]